MKLTKTNILNLIQQEDLSDYFFAAGLTLSQLKKFFQKNYSHLLVERN